MAQYIPPSYQQPQPENRERASSAASMNRYVPQNYTAQAPQAPPSQPPYPPGDPLPQQGRARGPSFADYPINGVPPVPQNGPSYIPPPPLPQGQYQPPYQNAPSYQPQAYPPQQQRVSEDAYMRPPFDNRRLSASSARSRRSQDSRHSHRSHRSSSSRGDRDRSEDRRHHHHHHHHDDHHHKPKKVDSHRPSWGDSIYSMFNFVKESLGPRDKY